MIDTRIGKYDIVEELGTGGMGTVYHGIDSATGEEVAIKSLKAGIADAATIERFRREGETLRELNHPNIVQFLDAIEVNGHHYLIMELVRGGTLRSLLDNQERVPIKRLLNIALDLADALTRAHRLNIIHRDIKPENILLTKDGMPRLTDFGIARVTASSITDDGAVMGTLAYLSPETVMGEPSTTRADIWAFGVLLFELLTGKNPFRGANHGALIHAILNDPLPDLEQDYPDVPVPLIDLIYRMLTKNPDERIPTVRLVGVEIEALLSGTPAQNYTPVPRSDPANTFQTPTDSITEKHNLPAQTTPFVGREVELLEVTRLIHDPGTRLVTIVAQGGMGKTRLALETGSKLLGSFEHGVYVVELATLQHIQNILPAVADALRYAFQPGERDEKAQLLDFLSRKHMLLIMDNYEHLMDGAGLVTEMLKAAPQLSILVTSRQRLNQSGEVVFYLEGMDFPLWETPADAMTYAAVKLFMQSARRIQPDFEINTDNMGYVARICKQVFGVPLGILLAASWIGMLQPEEIASEIAESIDFLETDLADLPERQRSIRAVFEYSWNLISPDEQTAFMLLSVFKGGFTREAAQVVTGANLRTLMSLMNKSLIRRDMESGRYSIHELLRQYAAEQLEASGQFEMVRDKHTAYYLRFLAEREADIKGKRQIGALAEIEVDFENVRAAWDQAVDAGQAERVNDALEAMHYFCRFRNRPFEGKALFDRASRVWTADSEAAPLIAGRLAIRFLPDAPESRPYYESGLAIAQYHGDALEIAIAQYLFGRYMSHFEKIVDDGIALMEQGLATLRQLDEPFYEAFLLNDLSYSYFLRGDVDARFRLAEDSYAIRKRINDVVGIAESAMHLSIVHFFMRLYRDIDQIERYLSEAVDSLKQAGNRSQLSLAYSLQASYISHHRDLEAARQLIRSAIEISHDYQDYISLGIAYSAMGSLHTTTGNYDAALENFERALSYSVNIEAADLVQLSMAYMWIASGESERTHDFLFSDTDSAMRGVDGVLNGVWGMAVLIKVERDMDEWAAELLGSAADNSPFWFNIQDSVHFQWLIAQLRSNLGENVFNAAWERGKTLDFVEIAYAVWRELKAEYDASHP